MSVQVSPSSPSTLGEDPRVTRAEIHFVESKTEPDRFNMAYTAWGPNLTDLFLYLEENKDACHRAMIRKARKEGLQDPVGEMMRGPQGGGPGNPMKARGVAPLAEGEQPVEPCASFTMQVVDTVIS